jgi:hypothetical protein
MKKILVGTLLTFMTIQLSYAKKIDCENNISYGNEVIGEVLNSNNITPSYHDEAKYLVESRVRYSQYDGQHDLLTKLFVKDPLTHHTTVTSTLFINVDGKKYVLDSVEDTDSVLHDAYDVGYLGGYSNPNPLKVKTLNKLIKKNCN